MTNLEIAKAKEEYEAKLENNKAMRAQLDEEVLLNPIKFNDIIHSTVKTLGDIIYHAVLQRSGSYYLDGETQTEPNKRRTVEDTYKLQRSYNIRCQFKDVKQAFEILHDNSLITWVFCKQTLMKTYCKHHIGITIEEINNCLEENNLNFTIREKKLKLKKKHA